MLKRKGFLNRNGRIEFAYWDNNPEINVVAHKKALEVLDKLGIKEAKVIEVAPALFWYTDKEGELNIADYEEEFYTLMQSDGSLITA